jgi:hypothetical protein
MEIGCGDGALGYQVFPSCVESLGWDLDGDILLLPFCWCYIGIPSLYLVSFLTLYT